MSKVTLPVFGNIKSKNIYNLLINSLFQIISKYLINTLAILYFFFYNLTTDKLTYDYIFISIEFTIMCDLKTKNMKIHKKKISQIMW